MQNQPYITVIIPAFNEEQSVGKVVKTLPPEWVQEVVVINNNSQDNTVEVAKLAGATVLDEPRQGYGYACLKGIDYCQQQSPMPDIVVFLDADFSDYPEELPLVVQPIIEQDMDMVIGSRAIGKRERGSMTLPQVFGNWLACSLIKRMYGVKYTDLGPFRAIKFDKLLELKMIDKTYGWTVEMQVKAAKLQFNTTEVAVNYKKRIGVSKVSGTIKGAFMAGYKILKTIFKYR